MKKKILSATLILTALVSFNVSAQQPSTATDNVTEATLVRNVKAEKKDKAKKDCCKGKRPDFFKGITLTADQQTKLDALRPRRPQHPEGTDAKADKANGSKDGFRKECKDGRRHNGHGGMKAEYIKNVKEILTPDQYVVFLENIVLMPGDNAPRHGGKACHRNDGNHNRTECPENGNTADCTTK